MDLDPFLSTVRRDLVAAARAVDGDETPDTTADTTVNRVLDLVEPGLCLAALELLSQAAEEMSATLPAAEVSVRLRGRRPELVLEASTPARDSSASPDDQETEDDDPLVRVSLRIPESVKTRAEEEAARGGLSLNAWLVGVIRAATWRGATPSVDLTSIPIGTAPGPAPASRRTDRR